MLPMPEQRTHESGMPHQADNTTRKHHHKKNIGRRNPRTARESRRQHAKGSSEQNIPRGTGFWGRHILTAGICARTNFSNAIKRSMKVTVHFRTAKMMADKITLTDSGATDNFIDPEFAKKLGVTTLQLERPRKVWNIDGTTNAAGIIKEYTDLEF